MKFINPTQSLTTKHYFVLSCYSYIRTCAYYARMTPRTFWYLHCSDVVSWMLCKYHVKCLYSQLPEPSHGEQRHQWQGGLRALGSSIGPTPLSLTEEKPSEAAASCEQAAGQRCGETSTILPNRVSECWSSAFAPSPAAGGFRWRCRLLIQHLSLEVKRTRDKYRSHCTNF